MQVVVFQLHQKHNSRHSPYVSQFNLVGFFYISVYIVTAREVTAGLISSVSLNIFVVIVTARDVAIGLRSNFNYMA